MKISDMWFKSILCPKGSSTNPKMIFCDEIKSRSGSGAAATSKVELFGIIVNGFQPLTIITKSTILDVAEVLDPPLRKIETGTKKPPELSP